MLAMMIGLSATGITAGVGLRLARVRQRHAEIGRLMGVPDATATLAPAGAQERRALREFVAAERRIRARSPHLSEAERRELALNLVRARGLAPVKGRPGR